MEGPLLEKYYLCEKTCRTTFRMEEDGSLTWIPPQAVVCMGLSEVAQGFSELTEDLHQKEVFQKQAQQFKALSKIVR